MLVVCRDVAIVVTTDISHMKPHGMYVVIFYVTEITFTMWWQLLSAMQWGLILNILRISVIAFQKILHRDSCICAENVPVVVFRSTL